MRLRNHALFCDPTVDRLAAQASQVQLTNPVAADLVSARLGDYQYVPTIDGLSDPKMQAAPEQRRYLTKPVTHVGHINLARAVRLRLDILTSRIPEAPSAWGTGNPKGAARLHGANRRLLLA
jgi:hypothetical protein